MNMFSLFMFIFCFTGIVFGLWLIYIAVWNQVEKGDFTNFLLTGGNCITAVLWILVDNLEDRVNPKIAKMMNRFLTLALGVILVIIFVSILVTGVPGMYT